MKFHAFYSMHLEHYSKRWSPRLHQAAKGVWAQHRLRCPDSGSRHSASAMRPRGDYGWGGRMITLLQATHSIRNNFASDALSLLTSNIRSISSNHFQSAPAEGRHCRWLPGFFSSTDNGHEGSHESWAGWLLQVTTVKCSACIQPTRRVGVGSPAQPRAWCYFQQDASLSCIQNRTPL